ncbi:caseinolytic peptidase B protein homolog isoform X2 [Daktulosphaira vitifoliae]|uniref:caseinolytic peptidase B protein homolog isoform X2 n=1 Tax=Daktulosphaira vitifoliae TaxID=58002 RepID=UPI0021AA2956|nr:caseinolytic peptidase B protein homolog isoform X2 [Daktulosphaira vitifoliae]
MNSQLVKLRKNIILNNFWKTLFSSHASFQNIKSKCSTNHVKFVQKYWCDRFINLNRSTKSKKNICKWLLAASIVYAGYKQKDIYQLINEGFVEEFEGYLKENPKDVNKRHMYGWVPLHVVAVQNKVKLLETLLKNGADPNITDGFSNIYHVAQKFNDNISNVKFIRENCFTSSFNHNATVQGFTALHYAALMNHIESLILLIEFGADPYIKSVTGHKPINLTTDVRVYNLLLEYEKNYENIKRKREIEERKRFPLEMRLKEKIVGQDNAIKSVASAIRRKENGWIDDEHPLVFLFLGSSGIGKTELAKQIAHYMHKNSSDGFIRLDMSEYQQKHEVAKMIGSPPGYVGYDDGGFLTKQLTKNPNAVVLFDEGRLTDGQGKTIECKNAIFVMTSNLASSQIAEHAVELRKEQQENELRENNRIINKEIKNEPSNEMYISRNFKDKVVKPILKKHFKRDEFLGRINEIVYFLPFSERELKMIVQKELKHWQDMAKRKHRVIIEWDSAVEHVLINSYDISYGARSIKHEVERSVVSQLAAAHEKGVIKENIVIKIVADLTKGEHGHIFLKILNKNKFVSLDEIQN